MASFRLITLSDCKKTNRVTRRWKAPPKNPFHYVSRDKILQDFLSISAAFARGFSDRHFERGEGPGDEVAPSPHFFLAVRGLCYQGKPGDPTFCYQGAKI